jgi:hypothetical protein
MQEDTLTIVNEYHHVQGDSTPTSRSWHHHLSSIGMSDETDIDQLIFNSVTLVDGAWRHNTRQLDTYPFSIFILTPCPLALDSCLHHFLSALRSLLDSNPSHSHCCYSDHSSFRNLSQRSFASVSTVGRPRTEVTQIALNKSSWVRLDAMAKS